MLTGQDNSLQLENIGSAAQREGGHQQRRAVAHRVAQQTAADALGGQRGSVVALDVKTGAVLAMYSNPTFNPNGLVGARHAGRAERVQPASTAATTPRCSARTASATRRARRSRWSRRKSALETGIATPDDPVRLQPTASRSPGPSTTLGNFGGEVVRRHARGEPHRVVQRDVRAARLRAWATRSCPPWTSAASTATPPIDLAPERGRERRAARRAPTRAALRARRHRPGRRVHRRRWRWRWSPRASPTAA